MEKDLAQRLQAFHTAASAAGEDIAFRVFPTKQLIQSTSLSTSPYYRDPQATVTDANSISRAMEMATSRSSRRSARWKTVVAAVAAAPAANDTQYARYPNLVLSNKRMPDLHAALKKECEELVSLTDQVKLWISANHAQVGDNFGVQIQEEVIAELQRSQDSAFNLRDAARNNYLARAKISSKLIKYPNVEDYTLALKEHDESQLYFARQHLIDLRNIYAVLTDLIHKNIAKIRAPKGENSVALY
ncbi:proteasome activator pa28 REG alpha/beta subunit [Roridomyces roridus]|uniref:Proteasome activator pa28 REG alpha/beta subunit n=1 Tax=Roridomyces roridus TaxID=1738132 RepID=A0AAD7BUY2_9AGAR|nr:proteasome activator pa28 REG alpha/beta subunit [Roridomyces roridus]